MSCGLAAISLPWKQKPQKTPIYEEGAKREDEREQSRTEDKQSAANAKRGKKKKKIYIMAQAVLVEVEEKR